ncbi:MULTISPECIES: MATE family efflux transporter [Aeromicrobium]|uniref:MATE family efflux transporter n=1 Tax=Aeromicrobium yanjiei TaxID=2662028 RepID=A0A5Q2MMA6_9ACTN|nr:MULTISPECIES: MATE family efflux transporter [Aeromicrobium]MRK00040.1 MATE family efflux transporter [Aeromicrobium sp. S22]QGG43049.1 MATE family efflux transporter [Aeromicrobium yanjiei]
MRLRADVDRQILAVAVPAFFALVTEPLMLLADTAIIGHLGTPELAGLAAAAVVLGTVVGLCVFLAYGSTAAVARHHGAGEVSAAYGLAISSLWLAAGLGAVLGIGLAATSGPLSAAVSSSQAVADLAQQYLLVSTLGLPAVLVVLAATGAMRGSLDLRTPLVVTVVANVVNVVLNVGLVYGLDWGVRGAATGTVLAQWLAAAWLVAVIVRRSRRAAAPLAPRVGEILDAARQGVPLIVRTLTLRVSIVLATLVAADLGDVPLAAHQIAAALVGFLAFGLDAIAIAGQTLTGRALGAGDAGLTRALTRRMMAWGVATGFLAGFVLAVCAPWLPHLFTSDVEVRNALVPALLVVAAIQPLSGLVFVLDGVLIGAGDGVYLAVAGLIVLAAYTPLVLLVAWTGAGFTWLWVAYGGFIAARLATLWHRERGDAWLVLGPGRSAD